MREETASTYVNVGAGGEEGPRMLASFYHGTDPETGKTNLGMVK